jgi:UDP-glucose 4-epimerase
MQTEHSNMIALVLGAGGFIGSNLTKELVKRGLRVWGAGHNLDSMSGPDLKLERKNSSDITAHELIKDFSSETPDLVIHCCGSGSVAHSYVNPADDFHRSVSTVVEMLEYCRSFQKRRPRVVLVSSAAVYGEGSQPKNGVDTTEESSESSQPSPISPYGFHKLMAEKLVESYHTCFEIETSVVRLFSVYGEGLRKQLLWDACNKLSAGAYEFHGTGKELRDWIHVDDAARLVVDSALFRSESQLLINSHGTHASTENVLGMLAKAFQSKLTPTFTGMSHLGNPSALVANAENARKVMNFQAQISLVEGIGRYVDWYREMKANNQ